MSSGERAAFAGQITDLPVSELLRTVVHGKQTGLARFQTNLGSATLWFREGSIVDADMGRFHMGAAVRRLLTADTGTFEIEFKPISRRRLIKEDTQELLDSVDPPAPPELTRSGPRRNRSAPGWTPTAGGKGATRDAADPEPLPERPATPIPDTRRRLEVLAAVRARPTDESLHATAPLGPSEEDDDLTRVAKSPQLPTFPTSWAEAPLPTPPVLDLGRIATAPSRDAAPAQPPSSASATAMGFTSHALANVAEQSAAAEAPSERRPTPRRTQMGVPVMAPPSQRTTAPAEPARPSGTEKMPVQEPSSDRQRRRVTVGGKTDDGSPVEIEAEEISDPIPVGTTWDAPSHLSEPASSAKVDSADASSRSGEVRRRGGATDRTVIPFAPSLPFQPTKPEPGATVTDGFRPIPAGQGPSKPITDSYPAIDTAASAQRAASIASSIGLDPSASGVGMESEALRSGAAPAVVGRYEVLLRIARGGMGTVYLCRVTGAGGFRRLFALKVIRDHLSRNAEYVTMLLQEARIASRLHHPNVVGIVDIGTLANQHYLVMDYVEGCTFSELLKVHRKSRPPQLVIPIVLDALTGLHAAHSLVNDDGSPLTLVHCDFSPQNILVGTNGICRITDFGIARASNALPEKSTITRGKPAYLAPEQVLGRPFDHRADVFAAGVVLWNALTGEQLFGGETPEETLEMVLNRPIQPPSAVGLRPPRSLDRVVMRALQRDPDARYQTAEEMLIDLRRVAITEDLLAPASEVARWVTDTFGTQLELRRQAAGITAKPGAGSASTSKDSREISIPELGLGAATSATHALMHSGSDTHADDLESRTVMLHTGTDVAAATPDADALSRRQRNLLLGLAATMAGTALALAFMRPGWLLGGFLDEDGTYFEPEAPVILPTVVDAGEKPESKAPEGKTESAGSDGKSESAEPVEGAASDGKAEAPPSEASEPTLEGADAEAPPNEGAAIEPGAAEGSSDAEPIADPPSVSTPREPDAPTEAAPKPRPTPDPRRPAPAKPERPKPKPAKEPPPEPAEPEPEPPSPPDPAPDDAAPEPKPSPKPPPKAPAEEPSLPKPPDLKELLDGAP